MYFNIQLPGTLSSILSRHWHLFTIVVVAGFVRIVLGYIHYASGSRLSGFWGAIGLSFPPDNVAVTIADGFGAVVYIIGIILFVPLIVLDCIFQEARSTVREGRSLLNEFTSRALEDQESLLAYREHLNPGFNQQAIASNLFYINTEREMGAADPTNLTGLTEG